MSAGERILTDRLTRLDWTPQPQQAARMGASGASVVTEYGPTLWRLSVETELLRPDEARKWSAWINRRQGRRVTFTAWRLWRYAPKGAIGNADGSIGLTVDSAASTIALTGCGAYVASVGDMISYRTAANGYWAGEVQADASAVSGNVTLSVLPRPVAKHASAWAVRRVQALAEFELATDPGAFEDYTDRRLQFEAIQIVR